MVSIGDRISVKMNKGTDREGVVTGVRRSMLRVRWSPEEETSVVPAPGTLTVLGRTARKAAAPSKNPSVATKKVTRTRSSAAKKVASKKVASKKAGMTT